MARTIYAVDADGQDLASLTMAEVPAWSDLSDQLLRDEAWKDFVRLGLLSADQAVDLQYVIRQDRISASYVTSP